MTVEIKGFFHESVKKSLTSGYWQNVEKYTY